MAQRMVSSSKTVRQQAVATKGRFLPCRAKNTPVAKAQKPETGDFVASMMAGKVMTARVAYGT